MHRTTYVHAYRADEYCLTLHEYARIGPVKKFNSTSSAFAWDAYTIITCAHSVADAKHPRDVRIEGLKARPVAILRPQNWKRWGQPDVAVLVFAKPHGLPVAKRSTDLNDGARVYSAYAPYMPVRFGKVTRISVINGAHKWRTFTATLVPEAGHSGGPLFNSHGKIIGMAIEAGSPFSSGGGKKFGIYIPMAEIDAAVTRLKNASPC